MKEAEKNGRQSLRKTSLRTVHNKSQILDVQTCRICMSHVIWHPLLLCPKKPKKSCISYMM